jgi:F-type H+-transporting ATPase subunit delta
VAQNNTIVSGVAGRYAAALFELAQEAKAIDVVSADLAKFEALIASNPDMARFVKSPVFTSEEQVKALTPILDKAGIGGLAAKFLKLVAAKRRLFAVHDMVRAYSALVDRENGVVRAQVTVADVPSEKVLSDVKSALKDVAGDKVEVDVVIENAAGQRVGVEVKASATVKETDLRGLRKLVRLAGDQVKMGILLYDGDETLPLGDKIWAAPLATLWGK